AEGQAAGAADPAAGAGAARAGAGDLQEGLRRLPRRQGLHGQVRRSAMTRTRLALAAALAAAVLLPPASARSQAAQAPKPDAATPKIEPRADELMKRMSALLAKTKTFTLEAEESFDAEFANAYRVQLTNVRSLTLERPSRFVASAKGDTANRNSWYDGKTLT